MCPTTRTASSDSGDPSTPIKTFMKCPVCFEKPACCEKQHVQFFLKTFGQRPASLSMACFNLIFRPTMSCWGFRGVLGQDVALHSRVNDPVIPRRGVFRCFRHIEMACSADGIKGDGGNRRYTKIEQLFRELNEAFSSVVHTT